MMYEYSFQKLDGGVYLIKPIDADAPPLKEGPCNIGYQSAELTPVPGCSDPWVVTKVYREAFTEAHFTNTVNQVK